MKRKYLIFLFLFLFAFPNFSIGANINKNIDVIFDDIKMNIDGVSIPHRDLFYYNNQLFVSIDDLASKFNLVIKENGSNISFSSSANLLNPSPDNLSSVNYQTGFEILTKNKIIKNIESEINKSKTPKKKVSEKNAISVSFDLYNIFADGKSCGNFNVLKYDGHRYMNIVDLSPILYITPSIENNVLSIDSNNILNNKTKYSNSNELARFRKDMNERLNAQLLKMEKKKDIIIGKKIPYEDIKNVGEMEKYINKYINKIADVYINTSVKKNSNNWYYLSISVDNRSEYKWRNLSRRDIESTVWDMYIAISSLYDENASIQGHVYGPNYRYRPYVDFNTNSKNIYFNFIESDLNMKDKVDPIFLKDILNKRLSRYSGEYFNYKVKLSGYDIELEVHPENYRPMEWSVDRKISFLNSIKDEISYYYPQVDVYGNIIYSDYTNIHFNISNGIVSSSDIREEMKKHLEKHYGRFYSDDLRINVKYEIFEDTNRDYTVQMYLDFDISQADWSSKNENDLKLFMDKIVGEIISIWDVNVSINSFDKKHQLIREDVISQDIVQAVYSEPISGTILEHEFVHLISNTEDATIYYTLDGSYPDRETAIKYTGPIKIIFPSSGNNITIKAYAVKNGISDSPVSQFHFTVKKINEN